MKVHFTSAYDFYKEKAHNVVIPASLPIEDNGGYFDYLKRKRGTDDDPSEEYERYILNIDVRYFNAPLAGPNTDVLAFLEGKYFTFSHLICNGKGLFDSPSV